MNWIGVHSHSMDIPAPNGGELRGKRPGPRGARGGKPQTVARCKGEIVLIEDDEGFIADLLSSWHPPCPISVASTGREAFEYLQHNRPVLVLLDLCLPHFLASTDELEGFEILSHIKTVQSSDIPVIVMSRERSRDARARTTELGAAAFLEKPFAVAELETAIKKILDERRCG
ncbi:MAG: response regulator [bacterium]|nr:MAG: response regulator [bacterium]